MAEILPGETLVLGSNGYLGLHIVDALRASGVEPRCGRRARANVLGLLSRKAKMVVADLDQPDTLDAAMAGCTTVVHVAGHYPKLSLHRDETLALGIRQAETVAAAAKRAGVRRFVYVSSTATVAPGARVSTERDTYEVSPTHGVYHALKWEMERVFRDTPGLGTRIALPSGCVGPGDLRMGTSGLLVALARGMDPAHADGPVSLVDPRDAATGVAQLVVRDDAPDRVILSAFTRSLHGLLVELADRYGVAPPSPALPAAEALARAEAAEREAERTRTRPTMSQELVELAVYGVPLDNHLSTSALGVAYRPFSATLADFDRWASRLGFLPQPPEARP